MTSKKLSGNLIYYLCLSGFPGSPEPDGSDQHRHSSEGRPQHSAARERLQRSDSSAAADTNTQHCSQHTVQVTVLSHVYWPKHCGVIRQNTLPAINVNNHVICNRTPGQSQSQDGMTPQSGGGMTPRGAVTPGVTPIRTPLRDKLNINSEEQLADPAFAKHMVNIQLP